jgi:hypothetical protein
MAWNVSKPRSNAELDGVSHVVSRFVYADTHQHNGSTGCQRMRLCVGQILVTLLPGASDLPGAEHYPQAGLIMAQTVFRAKMAYLLMYALNRCSRRTHLTHLRLLPCLCSLEWRYGQIRRSGRWLCLCPEGVGALLAGRILTRFAPLFDLANHLDPSQPGTRSADSYFLLYAVYVGAGCLFILCEQTQTDSL